MAKNVYQEQMLSEGHKGFKEISESENVKIMGENNVDRNFLMLKVPLITNLCWKNRL
jgi:hypothetical protein